MKRYLITGIVILAPIVVTLFLLWKSFLFLDGILAAVINAFLRNILGIGIFGDRPIPGLGLIALIAALIGTGFAARHVGGQWVINRSQKLIDQIPLINRVYRAIQQIGQALFSGRREVFKKAVLIEYPRKGVYSIAIMTADTSGPVQDSLTEDMISVFLPTTPNPTSGFLLFVPKKEIIELDISVEEALKLIISGGTVNVLDEKQIPPSL